MAATRRCRRGFFFFFSVSNDIERRKITLFILVRWKREGGGWKGAVEWRDSCPGRGFALNGGGGRASEIKRPVDGLFSCAVMYGLPPPLLHLSNDLAPSSLSAPPSLSLLLEGEGRDLPRRPGQFRCDKEVDRDGRYAASSLSLSLVRVYEVYACVCGARARARPANRVS